MRDLTDLFITAAALAAVAQGRTTITGVANQRVKECDRIAATVSALRAIGVEARETPDGLEIDGNPNLAVDHPVVIECHNDHRMAMSFAVLAARFPNIIIGDKRCVDKTYPGFWDDMHARFGLDFDANVVEALQPQTPLVDAAAECISDDIFNFFDQSDASTATVVLIGMRGAGKSSLGAALAAASNRILLDTDALIPLPAGVSSIAELVARDGWPEFRALECETICKALNQYKSGGAVIVCGGGAIETPQVRDAIAAAAESVVVIEIRRNIDDIDNDLQLNSSHRPSLGQSLSEIYQRRAPLYAAIADAEFNISRGDRDWTRIQADFLQFAARLLRKALVTPPPHSFFVCLTAAEYDSMTVEALEEICRGGDAVELRADLLDCVVKCPEDVSPCLDGVRHAISVLRRLLPRGMPLIFTVRTLSQGGAFRGSDAALAQLWELGARLAADVIDIEWAWPLVMRLPSLYRARKNKIAIIASHHFPHNSGGSQDELFAVLQSLSASVPECSITADVCKLVIRASSMPDVLNLLGLRLRFPADRPLILLAMGAVGQMSRLLNCHWTPCTHPSLRAAAAGQLTVLEIQQLRAQLNMSPFECLDQRLVEFECAVIGQSPIASVSPSPRTHNAAFQALHLPYRYGAIEASDFDVEPAQWLQHPSVLGASVTIPFKERAMRFCVDLSPSARTIGAVNTLIKCPGYLSSDFVDLSDLKFVQFYWNQWIFW
jgi:pentafunctional AROM polypeptide